MSSSIINQKSIIKYLVPDIPKEEYEALKNSIKEKGLHLSIINQNNVILDGHHRYRACTEYEVSEGRLMNLNNASKVLF